MKKEILIKLFLVLLLVLFLSFFNNNSVYATSGGDGLLRKMENQTNAFLDAGRRGQPNIDTENVVNPIVEITQILITVGAGVMVAVTTYMGIRYLISSPEEQAKLKGQLIGLVVAGVVIFGAYYIWKIVLQLASEF